MKTLTYKQGVISGVTAFGLWGILPLYWKLLSHVPALQIFSHRMLWSFVLLFSVMVIKGDFKNLTALFKSQKRLIYTIVCALLLSLNWYIYIWAVNKGYVIEASMGYYINPIAVMLLGTLVFKEKMSTSQKLAFLIVISGVIYKTIAYGQIPYVALALAVIFALYGFFKKLAGTESITGLTAEAILMLPIAIILIGSYEWNGNGVLSNATLITFILLITTGIVTAVPLILFGRAANSIPLTIIGMLQYIAPSVMLILGVFLFGETFGATEIISFGLIIIGLIIFTLSQFKTSQSSSSVTSTLEK